MSSEQTEQTKKADNQKQEIEQGKGMAILSYFGVLALIPYFAEKKNKFVRFHAIEGMNLLILVAGWSIVVGILNSIIYGALTRGCFNWASYWLTGQGVGGICKPGLAGFISFVLWLPAMLAGVLAIIGIVNAANGKKKELPIIGKFKIIKK